MLNFTYCTPTKVIFGQNAIENLTSELKVFGSKVLLVYGGGSIKKQGLYDKILNLLQDFQVFELNGVDPNPKITSVRDGVNICKKEDIDVILAVGGGSVIDCSKAIAAGHFYNGDPWDLLEDPSKIVKTLPLINILTIAAAGSNLNNSSVISNSEQNKKLDIINDLLYPKVSICDPTYTYSVPVNQLAAGATDIISHIFEVYFVKECSIVTDGLCEAIIKSVIENTRIILKDKENYKARSEFMWASCLACNNICSVGNTKATWIVHALEHELSAFYDITHAVGLSILTPKWMEMSLNDETVSRFAKFAHNIFNIAYEDDLYSMARKGIKALDDFYEEINIKTNLSHFNIDDRHFEEMAEHASTVCSLKDCFAPLDKNKVIEIYKLCL